MQQQLDFEKKRAHAASADRHQKALDALRTVINLCSWHPVDIFKLAEHHGISRNLEVRLIRMKAIDRRGKRGHYEYKALPLLLNLSGPEFLARAAAIDAGAPVPAPAAPDEQESLLTEDWFRWFAGGLIVGGVLVGLIVKLLM